MGLAGRTRGAQEGAARARLGGPMAAFSGWAVVGAVSAVAIELHAPFPVRHPVVRLLHHAFDMGQCLAAGLASAAVMIGVERIAARSGSPPRAPGAIVAAILSAMAFALSWATLPSLVAPFALEVEAGRALAWLRGPPAALVRAAALVLLPASAPLAALAGRVAARDPARRALALVAAAAIVLANDRVFSHALEPGHAFALWAAALLAGGALADAPRPGWLDLARRRVRWCAIGIGAWAAASLAVPAPPAVMAEAAKRAGAVCLRASARSLPQDAGAERAVVPAEQARWFRDRSAEPPTPSTIGDRTGGAIVLLLTVDSLRADVVDGRAHDAILPRLAALRDRGAHFTAARAPGSQTATTFPSIFTGKYFSELAWTPHPDGRLWPHEDPTRRLPALLGDAGVDTVDLTVGGYVTKRKGLTTGFAFERLVVQGAAATQAEAMGRAVVARLEAARGGPLLLFAHFLDAHDPYANVPGSARVRYLHAIGSVDTAIGVILDAIQRLNLGDRATVIVTADHGEGLGAHGAATHGVNVYDEVLRVPLIFAGPGVAVREIVEPVTLVDLGPTLLDLFGAPCPSWFQGESLWPALRGAEPRFTRPIVAENRLVQAMVFRDGIKAIRDLRHGGLEVYDLATDPGELDNLVDDPRVDARARFALLGAFFGAHARRSDGYGTPYRE